MQREKANNLKQEQYQLASLVGPLTTGKEKRSRNNWHASSNPAGWAWRILDSRINANERTKADKLYYDKCLAAQKASKLPDSCNADAFTKRAIAFVLFIMPNLYLAHKYLVLPVCPRHLPCPPFRFLPPPLVARPSSLPFPSSPDRRRGVPSGAV